MTPMEMLEEEVGTKVAGQAPEMTELNKTQMKRQNP